MSISLKPYITKLATLSLLQNNSGILGSLSEFLLTPLYLSLATFRSLDLAKLIPK